MWATECSDCHVPLHSTPGEELAPATRQIPALEDLVLLMVGGPWELQALAGALQDQGISSQIDTHPLGASISESRAAARGQNSQLGIYVGRADLASARAFAMELAAQTQTDADAAAVVHDPSACPACGEPTPDDAAACSACGLEFPEVGGEDG